MKNLFWNITNIMRWIPVLWNNWDWDFCFLLIIMEHKLNRMASRFESKGCAVDSKKMARQIRICALLCERIKKDNYDSGPFWIHSTTNWLYYTESIIDQDVRLLTKMLNKHMRTWWD